MNAIEFIKARDQMRGEDWSNDTEEVAKAMEEYATFKIKEFEETLAIDYTAEKIPCGDCGIPMFKGIMCNNPNCVRSL